MLQHETINIVGRNMSEANKHVPALVARSISFNLICLLAAGLAKQ